VRFVPPSQGGSAFSFTFTDRGISNNVRGHELQLEWKTTGETTISHSSMVVTYQTERGTC
jgi:hypothetical protein